MDFELLDKSPVKGIPKPEFTVIQDREFAPIKVIPPGYRPSFGLAPSGEPWIEKMERRGWVVNDTVKVAWGLCTGLLCNASHVIYANDISQDIVEEWTNAHQE